MCPSDSVAVAAYTADNLQAFIRGEQPFTAQLAGSLLDNSDYGDIANLTLGLAMGHLSSISSQNAMFMAADGKPAILQSMARGAALNLSILKSDLSPTFAPSPEAMSWSANPNFSNNFSFGTTNDLSTQGTANIDRYFSTAGQANDTLPLDLGGTNVSVPPTAVTNLGVIYLRTDAAGGPEPYVGQSVSWERYLERQGEHANDFPGSLFQFDVLDRATPGTSLDVAEENWIRQLGGPTNKSNPDGLLSNKRYQMNDERYRAAGGTVDKP